MSADAVPILVTNPVAPLESLFNVPIAAIQSVRQQFNFRWANVAARNAQTGMRIDDRGFQADIGIVYRFNGAIWAPWESEFAGYTPALTAATTNPTLGTGGTASGYWAYVGGLVVAYFSIVFGSSGVAAGTGGYFISLPAPATIGVGSTAGTVRVYHAGNAAFGITRLQSSTTLGMQYTSTFNGALGNVGAGSPFTAVAGDIYDGFITYQAG